MRAFIGDLPKVIAFRKEVRDALQSSPLSHLEREEVLLALTEMGTNLVFHARGGSLEVTLPDSDSPVVRIGAKNRRELGTPAPDRPGVNSRPSGGLGIGLSSLERLMDRVKVETREGSFCVTCEKDIRTAKGVATPCPSSR